MRISMYSFLITTFVCIALSVSAIRYKSKVSLSFAFLCFCCAMWSVELYLLSSLENLKTLLPLFHTFRVGLFFIGPAMLLLSVSITNTNKTWANTITTLSFATGLSISILNNTVLPSNLLYSPTGYLPEPDLIGLIYKINFVMTVICSLVICAIAHRKTIFTERQRITWVIMAYFVGSFFGVLSFSYSKIFGTLGAVSFLSLLAYAVFRYRLISTRVFASQLLAKSFIAVSLAMGLILINEFTLNYEIMETGQVIYSNAVYMLCCFGLYNKLQSHFQPYTNSLLISHFYDLKEEQSRILNTLSHCLDCKDIKGLLDDIFYRLIKVDNYTIYLCVERPNVFKEFNLVTNIADNKEQTFNDYAELTYYEEASSSKKIDFTDLKQSVFLPISLNSEVIGMITLGQPQKKEQFTYQDTQLLIWLSDQLRERIPLIVKYNETMYELEQARQTLSMVETFNAYNHDVKAPLNNINAVIKSGNLFSEEEKSRTIQEQVEFGLKRITTMCDILNGRNNQQKQSIDLNKSITNIHNMFAVQLGLSSLDLKTIPKIFAKKDLIEILLTNLYKNAIEASDKSAQIRVKTNYKKTEGKIMFQFSDKGKGMPKEVTEKLFTQSMTTKKGGSGVGMSLIKNIINELDGTIDIKSVVGIGTTFTFHLSPAIKKAN
jgi:signal transduction histidine kinase